MAFAISTDDPSELAEVLQRDIPWETYMTARLITDKDLQLIRRYDKRAEDLQASLIDEVRPRQAAPQAAPLPACRGQRVPTPHSPRGAPSCAGMATKRAHRRCGGHAAACSPCRSAMLRSRGLRSWRPSCRCCAASPRRRPCSTCWRR